MQHSTIAPTAIVAPHVAPQTAREVYTPPGVSFERRSWAEARATLRTELKGHVDHASAGRAKLRPLIEARLEARAHDDGVALTERQNLGPQIAAARSEIHCFRSRRRALCLALAFLRGTTYGLVEAPQPVPAPKGRKGGERQREAAPTAEVTAVLASALGLEWTHPTPVAIRTLSAAVNGWIDGEPQYQRPRPAPVPTASATSAQ